MDGTLAQLIQEIVDLSARVTQQGVELEGLRLENTALRQQLSDLQDAYDALRATVPNG